MAWLYSIWFKPALALLSLLGVWGLWKWGQAGWAAAEVGRSAEKMLEVEREAAKVDKTIERKIEELEVVVRNAEGRDLVCDPDFRRWLRGLYGEDRYPPGACPPAGGGQAPTDGPQG